nr:MAG TPA: MIT DOMAIN-CONTAINING PROTEIN 1, CHARGED TRANSPORT, ESCRT, CYTOKINESIS, MIDBODY [Caudoviricetes sp.]
MCKLGKVTLFKTIPACKSLVHLFVNILHTHHHMYPFFTYIGGGFILSGLPQT